jgi:hypothetical protein
MDIVSQVKELNLPLGQYLVVGSGVMSVHGIRAHNDIDLLVTEELYQDLKKQGWEVVQVKPGLEVVRKSIYEASPQMVTLPNYHPNIQDLIARADIINGVAFISVQDLLVFKTSLGREKDLRDIDLIKNYLTNKTK